jgi:hypothetical protein
MAQPAEHSIQEIRPRLRVDNVSQRYAKTAAAIHAAHSCGDGRKAFVWR